MLVQSEELLWASEGDLWTVIVSCGERPSPRPPASGHSLHTSYAHFRYRSNDVSQLGRSKEDVVSETDVVMLQRFWSPVKDD
ncbi:hypothetical protein EVAR_86520_1 [Eumeta japonica]|uniref:Uncharacterized protein n=1 Tax=Eumeta variegata TaxID=151549 RepID=A0A4C1VRC1_EUMVA|nr:hypothetical protein EVAR_86520_1 [Eumeta japonica]